MNYKIIISQEEPKQLCEYCKQPISKYGCACAKQKEESKQETLEEMAERRYGTDMDSIRGSNVYDLNTDLKRGFIEGVREMQKQMYNEEEVLNIIFKFTNDFDLKRNIEITSDEQRIWFEQFKKK